MKSNGDWLVTIEEASGMLGVSTRTIYLYIDKGLLTKYSNITKSVRFLRSQVEELAEERSTFRPDDA